VPVNSPSADRDPDRDPGIRAVQGVGPTQIRYGLFKAALEIAGKRYGERRRRGLKPTGVKWQLEDSSADHQKRLEDPVTDLKPAVGDSEQGSFGRLQPPVDPDDARPVHRRSRATTLSFRSGKALLDGLFLVVDVFLGCGQRRAAA
jgi:hypothetical protein